MHVLKKLPNDLFIACDEESSGLLQYCEEKKVKVGIDLELFKPKMLSKEILEPHQNFAPQ